MFEILARQLVLMQVLLDSIYNTFVFCILTFLHLQEVPDDIWVRLNGQKNVFLLFNSSS